MGKIIRNGIEYCGTSDTADNIIYDNKDSGLAATTVQAAVDKVAESLGGIEFAIVDGKPQWKERGADSFSPFKSNPRVLSIYYVGAATGNWRGYDFITDTKIVTTGNPPSIDNDYISNNNSNVLTVKKDIFLLKIADNYAGYTYEFIEKGSTLSINVSNTYVIII